MTPADVASSWLHATGPRLSAAEQAKAWALREVWRQEGKGEHGLLQHVARTVKNGDGSHPSGPAIHNLFKKIDDDTAWFPGKARPGRGPKALLAGSRAAALAKSAMAMKAKGVEPTYSRVIAACPHASRNPDTKKTFSKKRVYAVLKERCFDDDAGSPWKHKARYCKTALTEEQTRKRLKFAHAINSKGHTAAWYYKHVVWTDLCSSILPTTEQSASDQALARKGTKGWVSPGSELATVNLRGRAEVLKQKSWNTQKVWWAPVLARGKLHVVLFDDAFPGENADGAKILVHKVAAAVQARFPAASTKPHVVFVDRGKGFFLPSTGRIVPAFKAALDDAGLEAFWGDSAAVQPGHLQELMLHETAVAWLRQRLAATLPSRAWEETPAAFGARLRMCALFINKQYDVEGLCRAFPRRVQALAAAKGGRLKE